LEGGSGVSDSGDSSVREKRIARLSELRERAEGWAPARALGTLRETMVFAVGNPFADIVFVGEAPGSEEERMGEPFVGPAGQKLTKIIAAMGLKREEVYISNICKFRPAMENQGSGNRKPTLEEMQSCLPFIVAELGIIEPRMVVALGATAAEGLGLKGAVSGLRGRFHDAYGIPMRVTFHPSFILREERDNGGMRVKRQVWEDMLAVMDFLRMPVSEKQRGYFSGG
jgi:DNA polymerase